MIIPLPMDHEAAHCLSQQRRASLWPLYLLFVLSGLSALVYEVMWTRSFSLVFGSTTHAASVVLAAFFFGMGLGNLLGGRLAKGRTGALFAYAWIEIAIGASALIVLVWVDLYHAQYPRLYQSRLGTGATLTMLQLLLAFAAMAPPCVAMGATLPLVSRSVVTGTGHLARRVGGIYALNTIGGVAGALLSGFGLPVWLGIRGTVLAAALLNAGVGIGALLLWLRWRRSDVATEVSVPDSPAPDSAPRRADRLVFLVIAALSGFGTLALEVLYTRLILNAMDGSVHSFAVVLSIFLVSLALGSALVAAFADRVRSPWMLVGGCAAAGAILILISPGVFAWGSRVFPRPEPGVPSEYYAWLILFTLAIIGPGVVLIGMILPTLWKAATRELAETGRQIGRLTGVNTIGAVVGSLTAGFVLIPSIGVARGIALIAALYGLLALSISFRLPPGAKRWGTFAVLLMAFAGFASLETWSVVPVTLRPGERLLRYFEREGGSVAVTTIPSRSGPIRYLRLNDIFILGTTRGADVHRSQGRLGLHLHQEPRHVAFIGLATGMSVSAIKEFPSVEHVVAMELVPGVYEAAREFSAANLGILEDPRVEVLVADGRNHLYGTADTFDVIVGDLFFPWQAGTGNLYTAEHFRIVKDRLNQGGIFVQWFQSGQLSMEELRIIVGTFGDVFAETELWLNRVQTKRTLLGLVGRIGDGAPRAAAPPTGMLRLCGAAPLRAWTRAAPRNTDDFPIIEFSAASSYLGRRHSEFEGVLRVLEGLCFGSSPDTDR